MAPALDKTLIQSEQPVTALSDEDRACLVALSQFPGIGPRKLMQWLEAAGGPQALWQANDAFLKRHLNKSELEKFHTGRKLFPEPDALLPPYQTLGIEILTIFDADYPALLKEIYDPPVVLYLRGNWALLRHPRLLSVVGNRRISDYGVRVVHKLVSELAAYAHDPVYQTEVCIVSGLAEGVDGEAHLQALNHQLPTIAVFGCGIDLIYPGFHEPLADRILAENGLLISEYPLGYPGSKSTFPQRNRIVAGLSQGVLVAEGSDRSGSLITARLALEENRQVLTVPGDIFSVGMLGPLKLLKQGAVPVSDGLDILLALDWISEPEPKSGKPEKIRQQQLDLTATDSQACSGPPGSTRDEEESELLPAHLTEAQKAVLLNLSYQPLHLDQLVASLNWPLSELQEIITLLELDELVQRLPGNRVCRL